MYEAVTDRESYRQIREHEKAVLDQQVMQAYRVKINQERIRKYGNAQKASCRYSDI